MAGEYGEYGGYGAHGGHDDRQPVPARRALTGPVRQYGRADV
ncbi:hypothetical protein AB0I49_02155 [Streptomyces sp. NPDC050617]